jgi:hypothetical protein
LGRDNHPRTRQKAKLARKKPKRADYDRILIVSEGEKTEPLYFNEIRQYYRLHTANIRILPSDYGTAPQQVVNFAKDECLKTKQWEKVFCVFDRDDHPSFYNAIKSVKALNKKHKNELKKPIEFKAIRSIPCFELWFLLHFIQITHEIHRDDVIKTLGHPNYLPRYDKGKAGYFEQTLPLLKKAYLHSSQLDYSAPIN